MSKPDIEIQITSNRMDPFVLDIHADEECQFFLGQKVFTEVGEFKYNWLIEYMDRNELDALIDALTFARDYVGEVTA